jgi:hypothetical protein
LGVLMSNNNPFLNAFSTGAPNVPEAYRAQMQSIGTPTSVPIVQPVNQTPSNLNQLSQLSPLHELNKALGGNGLAGGSIATAIQKAAERKLALKNAEAYNSGILEATKKASAVRDTLTDITHNGWQAPQKNKFYQLGWQHQRTQELASQYRAEMVQERLKNPTEDPQALQDRIKQKYVGILGGINPEIANKYFIESAKTVDDDDAKLFDKASSKQFKDDWNSSNAQDVSNVISAESKLVQEGASTMERMQDNLAKSMSSKLQNALATGAPYQEMIQPMFDQVLNSAMMQDDTKSKLAILKTLEKVTMPGAQGKTLNLLSNPELGAKYVKAKQDIISQDAKAEKDKLEADALRRETNTQDITGQMLKDFNGSGLKALSEYTKTLPTGGVNYANLNTSYNAFKTNGQSLPEQKRTAYAYDLIDAANKGAKPGEILAKGAPLAITGEIKQDDYMTAYRIAEEKEKQKEKESKPRELSPRIINQYIDQIIPSTDVRTYRWAGIPRKNADKILTEAFQDKYRQKFNTEMYDWMDAHPQATTGQIESQAANIWNKTIKPAWTRDNNRIANRQGDNYKDVLYDMPYKTTTTRKTPSTNGYSVTKMRQDAPWAFDQKQFQSEAQKFYQRKGAIYDWMWKGYKQGKHADRFESAYQNALNHGGASFILKNLGTLGYPTWAKKAKPANPAAGKKVSMNTEMPPTSSGEPLPDTTGGNGLTA